MKTSYIRLLAVGLVVAFTQANAAPPAKLALQGARIIPVVGEEISEGTLLIENGKIVAIGVEVDIPYDATVVDVSGKVLFPGMIVAHTSAGLDRANENLPVAPYLNVYDSLDPSSPAFENALRDGLLTLHVTQGNSCVIGGVSRLVHPIGRTPDEMTVRSAVALKLATSPKSGSDRATQMATLREAFLELEHYLDTLAEKRYAEKRKEEGKEVDVPPLEARKLGRELISDEHLDDKHRNLVKLTDGRLDAWFYCGSATDVGPAIRTAEENGLLDHTVFVLGTEAYRAVDELKQAARPVVLSSTLLDQRRDPISGELRETFVPMVIHQAGLTFALLPGADSSLAERYLNYQAARCVREGIPRQAALEAITLNAARILGVDDRLGSLEVGKDACIVVYSGDPLEFGSWVELCYIDGVLAYDREKDVRLELLLGLEKKIGQSEADAEKEDQQQPPEEQDKDDEKKEEETKKVADDAVEKEAEDKPAEENEEEKHQGEAKDDQEKRSEEQDEEEDGQGETDKPVDEGSAASPHGGVQ